MSRKQPKRKAGNMVLNTIAGIFIVAIVCGVGFGVASADSSDDVARAGAFGFDDSTHAATSETAGADLKDGDMQVFYEQSALAAPSTRTLDAGMQMVDEMERTAVQRAAAEDAAGVERMVESKAKQGVIEVDYEVPVAVEQQEPEEAEQAEEPEEQPQVEKIEYNLPAVDWSVGREAFVAEWTARIDAYLAGSPLAGHGKTFAEAAWDNGVDPRWSPAISNTESGKGSVCFLPCNAWGWGASSWSDWDSAIREHVAGLAAGYGYSITPEAAATYCPPNAASWYSTTVSQMATI